MITLSARAAVTAARSAPYTAYTRATSFAVRTLSKINKKIVFDLILIAALILVSLSAYFIIEGTRVEGETVSVSIDGEDTAEISLSKNGEYPFLDGKNILVIEDGCAYMKSADCPRQFCVKTGKISKSGEKIVCLHNRVFVIVKGGEDILVSE